MSRINTSNLIIPFKPLQNSIATSICSLLQTELPFSIEFLVRENNVQSAFNFFSSKSIQKDFLRNKVIDTLKLYSNEENIDILTNNECYENYRKNTEKFKNLSRLNPIKSLFLIGKTKDYEIDTKIQILNQLLHFLISDENIFSFLQITLSPNIRKNTISENSKILNTQTQTQNQYLDKRMKELISRDYKIQFSLSITMISLSENNRHESASLAIRDYFKNLGFKIRTFPSFFIQKDQTLNILRNRRTEIYIQNDLRDILELFSNISTTLSFWSSLKKLPEILSENIEFPEEENSKSLFLGFQVSSNSLEKNKLYIPLSCFSSHMNIWGMTGEGKSRILYGIISQIIQLGKHVLIIDLKGEYKYALGLNPNILYIKPGSDNFPLALNIFETPSNGNINMEEATENHIEFLTTSFLRLIGEYDLSPQMHYLLQKAIELTTIKNGNFILFLDIINNPIKYGIKKNKISLSSQALFNRVRKLITGLLKKIFYVEKSNIDISLLSHKNVILDLEKFETVENDQARKFFLEIFLNYFFSNIRQKNLPIRRKRDLTNFIIFDEAQKIIPEKKHKEYADEQSIIGKAVWTLRAYGVSMIFSGTEPSIEESIKLNSGLTLSFFTKYNSLAMSNLLGIQLNDYLNIREHFLQRNFILSYRGKIGLVKSPEYIVNRYTSIDLSEKQKEPLQHKLKIKYKKCS